MSNPLDATPMQLHEELAIVWSIVEQEKEFSSRLKKALTEREKQVTMLRDALEVTHELYANASSGYGFARPKNPHNFCPDIDGCSKDWRNEMTIQQMKDSDGEFSGMTACEQSVVWPKRLRY